MHQHQKHHDLLPEDMHHHQQQLRKRTQDRSRPHGHLQGHDSIRVFLLGIAAKLLIVCLAGLQIRPALAVTATAGPDSSAAHQHQRNPLLQELGMAVGGREAVAQRLLSSAATQQHGRTASMAAMVRRGLMLPAGLPPTAALVNPGSSSAAEAGDSSLAAATAAAGAAEAAAAGAGMRQKDVLLQDAQGGMGHGLGAERCTTREAAVAEVHGALAQLFCAYAARHAVTLASLELSGEDSSAMAARGLLQQASAADERAGGADITVTGLAEAIRQQAQQQLQHESFSPSGGPLLGGFVIHVMMPAGWGNRLPSLVFAALLALASNRTLLLDWPTEQDTGPPTTPAYANSPLQLLAPPFAWELTAPLRAHVGRLGPELEVNASRAAELASADILVPGGPWQAHSVWRVHCDDNLVPLLQVNPCFKAFFTTYFPKGNVFHPMSQLLLAPAADIVIAADAFTARNFRRSLTVGIQIRTGKSHVYPNPQIYFSSAKRFAQERGLPLSSVTFFIATDHEPYYAQAAAALGDGNVAWTDNGIGSVKTPFGGNPGTEMSGLLDMFLLSRCDLHLITHGSSFGYTAAAWGGHEPYYVYGRPKSGQAPMQRTWIYRAILQEPCFWDAGRALHKPEGEAVLAALHTHRLPGWTHHLQCHGAWENSVWVQK